MFASVTRLRVRSVRFLPSFLWHTFRSQHQAARASGFFGGRLLIDSVLTFWTLTVWDSEETMRGFRGNGAHARVMPRLAEWCDEAVYIHWADPENSMPTWNEAYERLVAGGRLSRVLHPSKGHSDQQFPRPGLEPLIGADLEPRNRPSIQTIGS
jgi:hypothetical protein